MTEPNQEAAAGQAPEPQAPAANVERPTYQTAASEAVDVAADAVAQHVAATMAANEAARLAAAEAAAAREAAEAARAEEMARAAEAARQTGPDTSMPAAPSFSADGATTLPDATAVSATDASMAGAAMVPTTTAEAATIPGSPVMPLMPATPTADPVAPAVVATAAPAATPKPARRPIVLAWLRRLAVFVLSVALLVGGIVLGNTTFQRTRLATPAGGGEVELSQPPPDVAKEFITALAAGDSDAIRSALSAQPNKDITDEFAKFGIKKVMGVDTLGTSVDGPRSATEVLLHTVTTDGNKFDINLIILVNGNTIEGFR